MRASHKKAPPPAVDELFHAALAVQDPERRSAFLRKACGQDERLRRLLESLLKADAAAEAFFGPRDS